MADLLNDPDYWRRRANEARARADGFSGAPRRSMLGVADTYEQLARRAERRRELEPTRWVKAPLPDAAPTSDD